METEFKEIKYTEPKVSTDAMDLFKSFREKSVKESLRIIDEIQSLILTHSFVK